MAMAIGCYIRDASFRDIPVGAEIPKDLSKHLTSVDFDRFKDEIMRGAPEDWIAGDKDNMAALTLEDEDVLPGVVFNFRRRNDRVIREFGW